MESNISGLDWFRLMLLILFFGLSFFALGSIWLALLWTYIGAVIVFRLDGKYAGYGALILLILTPIALSLELNELAEVFAVNVFYLMCIMVFSGIWSGQKWRWKWLNQILDRMGQWLTSQAIKVPSLMWVLVILGLALLLVSGRYFIKGDIPHNSFLDMGGGVVHFDVLKIFGIGWFYQLGFAWNILVSNWAVLYTYTLAFLAGDFYLGIKIHQLLSIILAAWGIMVLWRTIAPSIESKITGVSAQILVALVYILNPFYLSVLNGVVEFGIAYSLLPWIIWGWIMIIQSKASRQGLLLRILILGVVLSFATLVSGITMVFTNVIPLAIIMLGIAGYGIVSRQELWRRIILFCSIWGVVVLVGLHMLVPTFFGYRDNEMLLDESQVQERVVPFVKDFYSPTLIELGYLQNKEGIVSEEIGYDIQSIPLDNRIIWLIWVSLGVVSILWIKKNKYILPFWLGSGIAGYLALGYSQSWLYRVLNEVFPYFWGLRTPGRFMMVFILGIALLGGLTWYYVTHEIRTKQWRIIGIVSVPLFVLMIIISARYQGLQMFTFWTVSSIDHHYPGFDRAKKIVDDLNPNQDYRILDLTRDDDGSWNHTRAMAVDQRIFNNFDQVLLQYSVPEWIEILRENNVKYIVTTSYDNYCDDRFENDKNLVSCYLLQRRGELTPVTTTIDGYRIYEVPEVQEYVSGDGIEASFSYAPVVQAGDKDVTVQVAEQYTPQFKWMCNNTSIQTQPERNGLIQSAILPANSECTFGYYKARNVLIAEIISYGLMVIAIGGGIWIVFQKIWKTP